MQGAADALPGGRGSVTEVDERDMMELAERDAAAAHLEAADEASQRGDAPAPLADAALTAAGAAQQRPAAEEGIALSGRGRD